MGANESVGLRARAGKHSFSQGSELWGVKEVPKHYIHRCIIRYIIDRVIKKSSIQWNISTAGISKVRIADSSVKNN